MFRELQHLSSWPTQIYSQTTPLSILPNNVLGLAAGYCMHQCSLAIANLQWLLQIFQHLFVCVSGNQGLKTNGPKESSGSQSPVWGSLSFPVKSGMQLLKRLLKTWITALVPRKPHCPEAPLCQDQVQTLFIMHVHTDTTVAVLMDNRQLLWDKCPI